MKGVSEVKVFPRAWRLKSKFLLNPSSSSTNPIPQTHTDTHTQDAYFSSRETTLMAHSTPPEKPLEVGGLRSPSWSLVVPALSAYIRTLTQTRPHVHMDTHTLPNVHTLTYASHTYAFSPGRLRKTRSRGISSSSQHRAVDLPGLCASCSPASRAEKTQVTQDTAAFSAAA